MIWLLLAMLWVVFLTVLGASACAVRRGAFVLGVAFSENNAESPEVKRILRAYYAGLCAVLAVSAAAGFLLFLPAVQAWAEMCMLAILVLFLLLTWLVQNTARRRLLTLRAQKGWLPPARKTLSADLAISRDKATGALSPVFVWICLVLSFVPLIILLAVPALRSDFPLPFAFIGPVCQLFTVPLYYQMRNLPVRTAGEDTAAATAFAQKSIRIHTGSAVAMAVSMLLFWLLFALSTGFLQNMYLSIVAIAVLVLINLAAAFWQQKKMRKLEEAYMDVQAPVDADAESEWKWGCYYNPYDPRIFVPKRVESLGWTVNIGRPAGKAILFGTLAVLVCIVALVGVMSFSGFSVAVQNEQLQMEAPLYDLTLTREQIESVELVDTLPATGTRTNGYGGVSKSYGHFYFDGYGACDLYVYNDTGKYVCLRLSGDDPAYVFLNAQTAAATETLYAEISQWYGGT